MTTMIWKVCLPLLLCLLLHVRLGAQMATVAVETQSADDVARWIEQLNADEFLVREEATVRLVAVGAPVIEPLLAAIREDGRRPEVNLRAVYVFKRLALAGDDQLAEASRQALEKVAAMRLGTATQKATETLASLQFIRQVRAFDALVKLGAKTIPENTQHMSYVEGFEFGEQWRGSADDLARLRYLPQLRTMLMSGEQVNDDWLDHLSHVDQLMALTVHRASISGQGIERLVPLQNLRWIEIRYAPIGDESVEILSKLGAANYLRLYGTNISPQGAERLRQALPMTDVDVRAGAFLGIGGDVHPLGVQIREVREDSSAHAAGLLQGDIIVTYEGKRVDDFKGLTALIALNRPKDEVAIQFVRNAESVAVSRLRRDTEPLGITAQPHGLGCEVTDVVAQSFALQVGVRKGDVIHRLNNIPLQDVAHLERLFAAVPQGEPVMIDFARRLDLRTIRVVLGEFQKN
jgi:hypothetical protein